MAWIIDRILHFTSPKYWSDRYAHYSFHDRHGNVYQVEYDQHWMGKLGAGERFEWTAGVRADLPTDHHIELDVKSPTFMTEAPDGRILLVSSWSGQIHRIDLGGLTGELYLDGRTHGMADLSACIFDLAGDLWVSELTGCRVHRFSADGVLIETLGGGTPGFNPDEVPFEKARFGWIYVLRRGPDGCIYVLDSTNFAIRRIDPGKRSVKTIVGTGRPGYTEDGAEAGAARLGGDTTQRFDGPYAMCVDESCDIFVGDTQNHVVRMIDATSQTIATIAGRPQPALKTPNDPKETDPLSLNLPHICGMDYHAGRLFVPELDGDLIVLRRR